MAGVGLVTVSLRRSIMRPNLALRRVAHRRPTVVLLRRRGLVLLRRRGLLRPGRRRWRGGRGAELFAELQLELVEQRDLDVLGTVLDRDHELHDVPAILDRLDDLERSAERLVL